jgi:hypothetical protein
MSISLSEEMRSELLFANVAQIHQVTPMMRAFSFSLPRASLIVVTALAAWCFLSALAPRATAKRLSTHDRVVAGNVKYRQRLSYASDDRKANYELRGSDPDGFPDFCSSLRLEIRQEDRWRRAKYRGTCIQGVSLNHIHATYRITLSKAEAKRFRRGTARLRGGTSLGASLILKD